MPEDKSIALGHPSYVWRFGQDKRLNLIRRHAALDAKRIIDIGCGIGAYVRQFRRFSDDVYGVDVDFEKVKEASKSLPDLATARGEDLPFRENTFDVVLLHEVLEHVQDDRKAVQEACRVARNGGMIVIYAPNRLYPFETHGFYLGKRYVFRLLPVVNWLPGPLRRIFVPHVRAYLARDLKHLFEGLPLALKVHSYVYPGFDNIAARNAVLASLLRRILYFFENTPFRVFGLSHFMVVEKKGLKRSESA
ncbi:MAG: class I SAM-dependent methyltransferase [Chloroflexi bacterium]|nr:class I SAM-dependent methyltransferase [Chloroflexota bacterium]